MIQLLGKIPDRVSVAVSGGPDSMAALDFLNNGKRSVTALYFHHGTAHGEIAKKFLRKHCFRSQVHLIEGKLQGPKPADQSLEEFWRKERYGFSRLCTGIPRLFLTKTPIIRLFDPFCYLPRATC